jgi:hypothetical protein
VGRFARIVRYPGNGRAKVDPPTHRTEWKVSDTPSREIRRRISATPATGSFRPLAVNASALAEIPRYRNAA